jgi:hypothetical protein
VATNITVVNGSERANRSDRSDSDDWSELERRFFESAPPDVAVPPPPPPQFDDLEPVARVDRRSRRRAPSPNRSPDAARIVPANAQSPARWRALATLVEDVFYRTGRRVAARAAAAWTIWASALAGATTGRRLGPALRARRVAGARRVRAFVGRTFDQLVQVLVKVFVNVFVDLPAERPDGKTTLAAAVALIVVCGLSASVLAHVRLTPPPAPDAVVEAPLGPPVAPR